MFKPSRVDLRPQGDAARNRRANAIVRRYGMGFLYSPRVTDPAQDADTSGGTTSDLSQYFSLFGTAAPSSPSSPSSSSSATATAAAWLKKNQNNVLIASGALLALAVLTGQRRRRS